MKVPSSVGSKKGSCPRTIVTKGGFPVIAETTRNHIFSKEISQVILAATVLAPIFYCKNCLRVVLAMRGNPLLF